MLQENFQKFKSNLELNETFGEIIERRHNAVRSAVENNGNGVKTKLIGSLQRQTRIQPKGDQLFDLDILVVLGSFYNWLAPGDPNGITPEAAMQKMGEIVGESDRYNAMNPQHNQHEHHIVWGTKYRREFLQDYVKPELLTSLHETIVNTPHSISSQQTLTKITCTCKLKSLQTSQYQMPSLN